MHARKLLALPVSLLLLAGCSVEDIAPVGAANEASLALTEDDAEGEAVPAATVHGVVRRITAARAGGVGTVFVAITRNDPVAALIQGGTGVLDVVAFTAIPAADLSVTGASVP
jgi:hypothetical protein